MYCPFLSTPKHLMVGASGLGTGAAEQKYGAEIEETEAEEEKGE